MRTLTIGIFRHAFWIFPLLSAAACATSSVRSELPSPALRVSIAPKSELPVRRVRFYESGVAEFERSGQLRGTMTLLPLPASDIDDVLRTLVIRRGPNLVPVHSASFDTVTLAKAARAQANLPPESKQGFEYSEYVQSLKGERVELTVQSRRIRGRLIDFTPLEVAKDDKNDSSDSEKKPARSKSKADTKPTEASKKFEWQEFELTILTDQGAIERYHTDKVASLRPVDPVVIARLGNAVAATSGRAGELSRVLQVTSEPGEAVNLTYVTEVPIARITYRLHASKGGQTDTLQGMTLVHNDTDEAWNAVAVEITNEDLDSSVVPFVAPRYWDRPMHVTRESGANFVPQLNKSSADSLSESGVSSRVVQGRTPSGSTSPRARKNTDVTTPKLPANSSRNPPLGHSDYTYAVATKSTIEARSSALLPFLETKVKAERGVWFGRSARAGRSVVRIQNTTSRPLPAGMLSVFDFDRFVGETELTQLEPGKYGYYDYANELRLSLKQKDSPEPKRDYRAVTWANDALTTRFFEHVERTVELTNASGQGLTAFLSISAVDGAVVKGADGVDTDFTGKPIIAIVKVPANAHIERTVVIEQEVTDATDADNLDIDTLTQIAQQSSLPAASRAALKEGVKILKAKQAMTEHKERLDQQISQLEETIGRLPMSESSQPASGAIAARFLQLESQRSELQKQGAALDKSIEQQTTVLKKALGKLPQK